MTYPSPPLSLCKHEWLTYHAFFQSLKTKILCAIPCISLMGWYGCVCVCKQRVKNQSKTFEFWLKVLFRFTRLVTKKAKHLSQNTDQAGITIFFYFNAHTNFSIVFLWVDFKSSCSAYTYYLGVIKSHKPPTLLRIQLFIVKEQSYMVWMKIYDFLEHGNRA